MLKDFISFVKIYLTKTKNLSFFLFLLFVLFIFLGYALAKEYPEKTKQIIYENLKEMFEPASSYSPYRLFIWLFFKNLTVATINVLLGIIFGIIPILIIFANGLILGVVSYIFLERYNIFIFLAGILPHGIFEIPAFIFSVAGGLWIWRSFYRYVLYDDNVLKKEFFSVIKFFILIVMPMLIAAALIEAFITPYILDLVMLLF